MEEEAKGRVATCQHCKKEVSPDSMGCCPLCGSNELLFRINVGDGQVVMKSTLSAVHKVPGISALVAPVLVLLLVSLINLGIEILPLTGWLKFAVQVIVFSMLITVVLWQGYRFMLLKRWLEHKFVAKKTFTSK